jgi:C-terminal processing protease CtpA/Prc
MALIEKRLHEHFASLEDDDNETAAPTNADISIPRDTIPGTLDRPFAKVNTVVENSPAATAGLKPGDLIRNFGYVNHENNDGLKKVAECVQGNEGVSNPTTTPPALCRAWADHIAAKYPRESITKQWDFTAPGAQADIDTTARLGR